MILKGTEPHCGLPVSTMHESASPVLRDGLCDAKLPVTVCSCCADGAGEAVGGVAAAGRKAVDFENLAFAQGNHLMTNKKCDLPQKSYRAAHKVCSRASHSLHASQCWHICRRDCASRKGCHSLCPVPCKLSAIHTWAGMPALATISASPAMCLCIVMNVGYIAGKLSLKTSIWPILG